jgi:micrococcal nuclease
MSRLILRVLIVSAAVGTHACGQAPPSSTYTGKVVGVSDGDTVSVMRQYGNGRREQIRVRLHGIDAPESRQAYGSKAKETLSGLVFDRQVRIEERDVDGYGRTVAVLWIGSSNVNIEMVRLGMAWHYRQYAPNDRQLAQAETEARRARRGLWADRSPVPPWDFRRGN